MFAQCPLLVETSLSALAVLWPRQHEVELKRLLAESAQTEHRLSKTLERMDDQSRKLAELDQRHAVALELEKDLRSAIAEGKVRCQVLEAEQDVVRERDWRHHVCVSGPHKGD